MVFNTDNAPLSFSTEKEKLTEKLSEEKKCLLGISSEKEAIFRSLVFECNAVADKFVQFKVWRNRYDRMSHNGINYQDAFGDVDEQINILAGCYGAFDVILTTTSYAMSAYLHFVDIKLQWLQFNGEAAQAAENFEELETVERPQDGWLEAIPNPGVESLMKEWKQLQFDDKLTDVFRQMQDIIKCLGSNGDLY